MRSGFECLCDSVFVRVCQKQSSVLKSNSIESIAGWWLRGSYLEVAVGVPQSPFIMDSKGTTASFRTTPQIGFVVELFN